MTYWALFWIELYFTWLVIEYIAGRYDMIKNNKMEIMGVLGLALFGIFIACASPEDPNIAIEDAKALQRAEAVKYNENRAEGWKEYYKEQESIQDGDTSRWYTPITVEEMLLQHKVDSTKIIAIQYPDDEFTDFEEAFMTARYELGKNKHFIWMKKIYSTNYREEGYSDEFTK